MGVDPNKTSPKKVLLHFYTASEEGHKRVVELLIDYGADINKSNSF